jgi:hypothetical protein
MVGIAGFFVGILIIIHFWMNRQIDIKWKIILTVMAIIFRFALPGIWSTIGTVLVLIIMFLMLRWNGVKIR